MECYRLCICVQYPDKSVTLKRVDFCSALHYNNNIHYTSSVLFYLCVKEVSAIRYLPPDCVRAFSFACKETHRTAQKRF